MLAKTKPIDEEVGTRLTESKLAKIEVRTVESGIEVGGSALDV